MQAWQFALAAVFVLPPFVLLSVFHMRRERLSSRGKPLSRTWEPQRQTVVVDDDHH